MWGGGQERENSTSHPLPVRTREEWGCSGASPVLGMWRGGGGGLGKKGEISNGRGKSEGLVDNQTRRERENETKKGTLQKD